MVEFQVVILAGGAGIRLYPLTETLPKCLLPANEKPLLYYQLLLLENAGFTDVFVVAMADMCPMIQKYLTQEYDGHLKYELCQVPNDSETADALRTISEKIQKDFIVIAGDLITDLVLHHVADFHRIHDAAVTMALKQESGKEAKNQREKEMRDCFGIIPRESRVVLLSQAVYMSEDVRISKALLMQKPNIVLHSDLYDAHFYIFSHWVLDFLAEKKQIASIKTDLIPQLIKCQFRGPMYLSEHVREKAMKKQQTASSLSLSMNALNEADLVQCFAYVLPQNAYCERADTIAAYRAIDLQIKSCLRIPKAS